jgi:putative ABC transport system permease protein
MSLWNDVRYGFRLLWKCRGFTAVAVLTLAAGIGANTAIFSMADAIISRPYPFPDPDRLVALWETIPQVSAEHYGVSPGNFFDWKEQSHRLKAMAAFRPWDATLTGVHDLERVRAYQVSPDFFPVLGVSPSKGRAFSNNHGQENRNQAVVSYGFWHHRLGADAHVIGRRITLNGEGTTIIGVMPREFDFPLSAELWTPWIATPEERSARSTHEPSVLARLRPGGSLAQAQAEMNTLGERLAREYPLENAGRGVGMMLLRDSADSYARRFMTVVVGAVVFLLLLASANVANLQLARGAARQKELAIRVAMGATGGRIARQLFTEGVLLSLLGAGLGLPLALWGLAAIKTSLPPLVARHVPSLMLVRMDARMLAFTLAAAVLSGIAFTLPAVWQASPRRLDETLKQGGRSPSLAARRRMRSALVISEIALAVVLLIGAGLMVKGFQDLVRMDQGFDPTNVLTFNVSLPTSKYPQNPQVVSFYKEALRRLEAIPEIQSVAVISELPALADSRSSPIRIEGQVAASHERPWLAEVRVTSAQYFRVLAMPVRVGRAFTPGDDADSLPVAMISESAARRFWPGQDPMGRRLKLTSAEFETTWLTVVGIVGDVKQFYLDSEVRPTVFVPFAQQPIRPLNFVLRTAAPLDRTVAEVREAVEAVDSTQPVYGVERMAKYFADLAGGIGVIAALLGVVAAIALALAAAGIFAVMAYSVAQRIPEIGIRMALGARPADVWRLVLGSALRLVAVGLGLGLPVSVTLGRVMSSVFSGVVSLDSRTFAGLAVVLSAVALLASYVPARRATKVDPVIALRAE